jgi:predicted dehydrogenase
VPPLAATTDIFEATRRNGPQVTERGVAPFRGTANKVGFAVVGLGAIAQSAVLPAFAKCKKAKLVALVSRDKDKAARLARQFQAPNSYGREEYAACLANPQVAAVYIATPQGEHLEFTVRAAEAGKHVLCEKPLAADVKQSARMVEACQRNSVLLMTAYRKYFEPSTVYLKKLIQDGKLGKIDVMHSAFSERHGPSSPGWLCDVGLAGGGPMMDLGVYCVNTSRWLVGEDPVEASARMWNHDQARYREVEEGLTFRLEFASGLIVQGSSTYSSAMSSFIYVQGTEGWVCLSPAFPFEEERRLNGKINGRRLERKFKIVDEFALEITAFADAIQGQGTIAPDGVQGHRDMVILRAIYDSARKRKPVVIRY